LNVDHELTMNLRTLQVLAHLSKTQVSLCHGTASVNFSHFQFLLKNCLRDLLQTWHKCSLWSPDYVLLVF